MSSLDEFNALILNRLAPDFCSDESRRMQLSGLVATSNRVTEADAEDFLRAWKTGLCAHQGRGQYLVGEAVVREQFFWSGAKHSEQRSFTLWMEPVITVAAIGRLHLDYKWPSSRLAAQSNDWAFDIVAKKANKGLIVAGEVKKARSEVDELIKLMSGFAAAPDALLPSSGKARNAFKKVASLRKNRAELLWVVGPDRYGHVFEVQYGESEAINLQPVSQNILEFQNWG